jgi:hypothetical protein
MNSHHTTQHVFVDFENVSEIDYEIIRNKSVHFVLMVGAKQTKLDITLVEELLNNASSVEVIRLTMIGKNALDFTLAYYLGRTVLSYPFGRYHIVSKDKGFDPLIEHLKTKRIKALRHDDFTSLIFTPASPPASPAPTTTPAPATMPPAPTPTPSVKLAAPAAKKAAKVVAKKAAKKAAPTLQALISKARTALGRQRPKKLNGLISNLKSTLGKDVSEMQVEQVIVSLAEEKFLTIEGQNLIYRDAIVH